MNWAMATPFDAKITMQLDKPPDRMVELEEYRAIWLCPRVPAAKLAIARQ